MEIFNVILLNALTLVAASIVVALIVVPKPQKPQQNHWLAELKGAWAVIQEKRLIWLIVYTVLTYFAGGFVAALATPMVLSISSPETVGWVMALIGSGMLVGNLFAVKLTRSQGAMRRLLFYDSTIAVAMLLLSVLRSPLGIGIAGFSYAFAMAGLVAEERVIWQVRIPADMQGRAFALRKALTWAALPLCYLLAGPLSDFVFEPFVVESTFYEEKLAPLTGSGSGRGMALLIVCAGFFKLLLIIVTLLRKNWKQLNEVA